MHIRSTDGGEPRERPQLLPRRGRRRAVSRLETVPVRARLRGSRDVQPGARQVRLPAGHARRRVRARPARAFRRPRNPSRRPAAVLQRLLRSRRVRRRFLPMPPRLFRVRLRRLPRRRRRAQTRAGHPLARSPSLSQGVRVPSAPEVQPTLRHSQARPPDGDFLFRARLVVASPNGGSRRRGSLPRAHHASAHRGGRG